jgi:hypothetical protein
MNSGFLDVSDGARVKVGAGSGGVGSGWAGGLGLASATPQFSQNAEPSSFRVPHLVQKIAMGIAFTRSLCGSQGLN